MSVFEEACTISNRRWAASLPTELEAVEFSKQHQKRMNILFDKMRRDKYHRMTRKATIALIAAILFISMTVTAFAIPATREFIIQKFFDHSQYSVVNGEQNEVSNIEIGYIPAGFNLLNDYNGSLDKILHYKTADNKWFDISKTTLKSNIVFDTETYSHEEFVENGIEYIIYYDGDMTGCIWNNKGFIYDISGNISKDELIKIALSITE